MAHKTLVAGTAYEVSGGNTLLDATQREISKGRSLVSGTGYDIGFAQVIAAVPSQSGSLTYTGKTLTPNWANYDSSQLSIGGTTSATNAGTYTATFTPKDGFTWADGSVTAKSVNWTIGKAAGSVTLSKTSISLSVGESTTISVSRLGDGAISVQGTISSSGKKVSTSISGTSVTVTGLKEGTTTVTVKVAEGTNHLAASKSIGVTVVAPSCLITTTVYQGSLRADVYIDTGNGVLQLVDRTNGISVPVNTSLRIAVGGAGIQTFNIYGKGVSAKQVVYNGPTYYCADAVITGDTLVRQGTTWLNEADIVVEAS